ncbi:Major facilitator superfamily domain general substrate transporter [Penicillium cf. griseofulvum]|uniref:Major facilitator superfamily domain general substrate transporter n=1 Tax=Penicillium cf. griseofulvum TaxID=2972120 RepID=A0A9W9N075_9EURO|nr:Major facilitator superfamily domain general substrate transporter [Penicillium cf. griseofulvum]KAJ5422143.1 Major facilitator superfamily domain general substrate transporter [Penicillium cf. griseofulvum]KAJ5428328.1 Major facilitator superfamily domain general substrate transporter [Penicillium cf. griseofulvum]
MATVTSAPKSGFALVLENPFLCGVASFSTLGGLLFGYDQGVISGVITMESFGARYPRVFSESGFKGWFVSTLLIAAWAGSLINGPIADRFGRKMSINLAVVVFVIGSILQCAAMNVPMLFAGRAIAGLAVGQLTMVVPLYISEVSIPDIRGGLVVLQQLSVTIGILISYWIDYGTNYIGGTRCAADIPYSGGTVSKPVFDPYRDVPAGGCTGQSEVSWRLPLALQIVPAVILGVGMLFFPDSPRWLLMKERDDDSLHALSRLRRQDRDSPVLLNEYLEIKASIMLENSFAKDNFPNLSGFKLHIAQYMSFLTNWSRFRRLAIGCTVMFFQQFMGCNAMIYYAPTIFAQLGLDGNTSSLLATGVYGIVNCLSTLPALIFIDKVGRRPLLMAGAAGTCISLVIVGGILGGFGSSLVSNKAAGWVGIAFIYIYDINFSYSFAPIGWVLPSEIFNLSIRSKAISITTSATWMCNFIIGLVTPDMLESITYGTYIFFAAFCLLAFAFTFFCIPETRGKTLEDMDLIFGDTAAHEEKIRIKHIEAELRGTPIEEDLIKPLDSHAEQA